MNISSDYSSRSISTNIKTLSNVSVGSQTNQPTKSDSVTLNSNQIDSGVTYDKTGKLSGVSSLSKSAQMQIKRNNIQLEIKNQINSLLISNGFQNDETDASDPLGLASYFSNNPADWEKVKKGEMPDYFNVENTAQRILDIWLPQDSDEKADFKSIRTNIIRAYDEVSQKFGGSLPQITLDTKDYILNRLDELEGQWNSK